MGYESTLNYVFVEAEIENLDELNDQLSKLEYGMGDVKITKSSYGDYSMDMKDMLGSYTGKFYDDKEFAELVSKYIVKGHLDLTFTGEDGAIWGFRIYRGKVKRLEAKFIEINYLNIFQHIYLII